MVFNINDSDRRKVKTDYPRKVKKIENIWIPMSDGANLSATMWIPTDAEENPVPAILEYLPYRKDDFTAIRDSARHPYFAGHGYASIRVDIRGTGNSDGILLDEYTKQEQDDALDILTWIEKQPWSTGAAGMIGKSWGGFNGLQVAARQHRALKTIITLCSTDDRYADDVHYRGGNILASDMLWWASTMFAYNTRPQDPAVVGKSWKENWMDRIENTPPFVEEWLTHQTRDDYWKHGSVCENYDDIQIPVFAVSGWQDGYTDAVFRLLENLPAESKGIIGPWAHEFPEVATPEPTIGFLQECIRWWDYWLKGIDTGIMDEPKLISWMQDSVKPAVSYDERPGKWVGDESWPSPQLKEEKWFVSSNELQEKASVREEIVVPSVQEHGFYAGTYCPFGQPGDLPADQRLENGKSIVFQSQPFSKQTEYLGHPIFHMKFSANKENAFVAVRLSDKSPTGESTLISWGMLNLNHLDSHVNPEALVPGKTYHAAIKLDSLGQVIPEGHCLEVAIAPTYWPQAWPSPEEVELTLYTGDSTYLEMPKRVPSEKDRQAGKFQPPETAPVMEREILRKEERTQEITHDPIRQTWTLHDFSDEGKRRLPANGIEYGSTNKNVYIIEEKNPVSAKVQCEWELTIGRGEWQTKVETFSEMTSDATTFYLVNKIWAYENDVKVTEKTWEKEIPRIYN
ncbi:CocE/NonD family hydrolase [Thalassobacillus devorans]|uniref:CocE/NonD family hydrolase n=1 Tax=Thalassobacillus devorans TaxID=279813 RepID=UPI00048FF1CA|nr:CocE/NonD family hydrolase [Thalassobacillus devorans]